jgi:hypothetical protein
MGFTLNVQGTKKFENHTMDITVTEASNHNLDDDFEVNQI